MAFARCGGKVEAGDGFCPFGTHTFFVDTFGCCFDGVVVVDFVWGFFGVVAFAATGDFC